MANILKLWGLESTIQDSNPGIIIWILFGLGYIFMIVTVITDGISKPARKAAKKLAEAEKVMLARIVKEIILKKAKVMKTKILNSSRLKNL